MKEKKKKKDAMPGYYATVHEEEMRRIITRSLVYNESSPSNHQPLSPIKHCNE